MMQTENIVLQHQTESFLIIIKPNNLLTYLIVEN